MVRGTDLAVPSTCVPPALSAAALAEAVDRLVAIGRAAHPEVAPSARVCELLAERVSGGAGETVPEERAADLYLAAAAAAGDPGAVARLDATLPAAVRPALARLGLPPSDDDEILQRVRVALFAPEGGGTPGIAGYSGRGELRAYVRAVAVRLALKRIEREAAPSPGDDGDVLVLLPDPDDTPELRVLKERCRGELRAAFDSALAGLEPRQRTLLRQHYIDGLTIDALGRLHGVHRATCARWIDAVRADLLRAIRRHLRASPGLGDTDLDSAIDLVRSQLDLSLARQLKTTPG